MEKTEDLSPALLTYHLIWQQGPGNELSDEILGFTRAVRLEKAEYLQTGLRTIHMEVFLSQFGHSPFNIQSFVTLKHLTNCPHFLFSLSK